MECEIVKGETLKVLFDEKKDAADASVTITLNFDGYDDQNLVFQKWRHDFNKLFQVMKITLDQLKADTSDAREQRKIQQLQNTLEDVRRIKEVSWDPIYCRKLEEILGND